MLEEEGQHLLREAQAAHARGAFDAAQRSCQALLERNLQLPQALNLLAEIAADSRQPRDGLAWAMRAVAADPAAPSAHYTLGRLLEMEGRLAEAEASYRQTIGLAAHHAKAHNNLGCVLHMQGRLDEALAAYRRAIELDPDQPEANQNYATIARDPAALEHAIEGYGRHVAANPKDAVGFNYLANTLVELGRHREALAAFEKAIAIDPDYAEAHFNRSLALLQCGEYREGWKEFEWRWRGSAFRPLKERFPQPMWDGRRIRTVLLHAEQGLGDTLQFVRYAPLVAARCGSVVLECQPELKALLRSVQGVDRVIAQGEALPPFDAHLPLMSLPAIFETTLETIPGQTPYVRPDPHRVAVWRTLLGSGKPELSVGLVWAGRPQQWDDRKRSSSLAMLAPLARIAGVRFYSLQKGEPASQAASPPGGMNLIDHTACIRDFSDTAALVSLLDLVVSVDTSVAHLAGAMGAPAWVLVAQAADWRYHLERRDNPWYPTMRLFRQERDGDWSSAVERVANALRTVAASRLQSGTAMP